LSIFFAGAFCTEAFELDALALEGETFLQAFYEGQGEVCKAAHIAAAKTGEMGMTLSVCAVAGKFEVPGSFMQIGLVDEACFYEAGENAVDCNFVRAMGA